MEIDHEDFDKFGGGLEFGECSTNKVVQFLPLYDVNGALIKVPFQSPQENLLLLLKYYL